MDIKSITKANPYSVNASQEAQKDQGQNNDEAAKKNAAKELGIATDNAEGNSSGAKPNNPAGALDMPLLGSETVVELLKHRPKPSVLQILAKLKWPTKKQESSSGQK